MGGNNTGWKPRHFVPGQKGHAPKGLEDSAQVSTLGTAVQSDSP
jgi:hypothetical protein